MAETQNRWQVHIAVPPVDVDGVRVGAGLTIPGERHGLVTESLPDGTEGDATLVVEAGGVTPNDAIARAVEIYRRAREAGRLSPDVSVNVIGLTSPIFRDEVRSLGEEAEQLLSDGRPELAIVRAQTACELWAKRALEGTLRNRLAAGQAEAALTLCRPSLNDRRTQSLILIVTGHKVTATPWWELYATHLKRRNGILHDGLFVTVEDASASLAVVEDCTRWLRDLWSGELDR